MDAYVFIRGAESGSISELRKVGDHGSGSSPTSRAPEDIFVAIEANGLRDVREAVIQSIRGTGLRDSDTSIAVKVPPTVDQDAATLSAHLPTALRRWFTSRQVESYTRVRVERGHARDVYDSVNELDGYLGHALVAGRCRSHRGHGRRRLRDRLRQRAGGMQNLDHVLSTETSFAFNEGDGSAF